MKISLGLMLALALAAAAEKYSFMLNSKGIEWKAVQPPGAPAGLTQKLLHENPRNKLQSAIVKYPKGYREPRHHHATCGHSIYILKGKLRSPDGDASPGTFIYSAPNERHGPFVAAEETEILFWTDGPFDYLVDDIKWP